MDMVLVWGFGVIEEIKDGVGFQAGYPESRRTVVVRAPFKKWKSQGYLGFLRMLFGGDSPLQSVQYMISLILTHIYNYLRVSAYNDPTGQDLRPPSSAPVQNILSASKAQ